MSRTFRRQGERHEYRWVLLDYLWVDGMSVEIQIDGRSKEGRKAIARFHSDAQATMGGSAPRWYRRVYDHHLRTRNDKEMQRWLKNPDYEPLFQAWHRHSANWTWW